MISKPVQVKSVSRYSIWVKFDDGTEGVADLSYLINKPIFKNWANPDFFDKVFIDDETGAIAWDNDIELCPDNLYLKIKGISFEQWKKNHLVYASSK